MDSEKILFCYRDDKLKKPVLYETTDATKVMAALPCAAVVTMFGEMYSITPGYAAELVGSTSILCIATLFPMIWYAQFLVTL